jgi:tRNA pseudouridine38-40 synthase
MGKFKITIAYDGSRFSGWQTQLNATSIQELIESAFQIALRSKTTVIASGRTDAGVHARGQVAHFEAPSGTNLDLLFRSLNGILPHDIRILKVEPAADNFHARYNATSKEYHYHIHLDWALDPFSRLYTYHHPYSLDLIALEKACSYFVGTHDFSSFANEASKGSAAKNPIRTLYRLEMHTQPGGVRLEFEGDGFLYKMVRNITGTLIAIGRGKMSVEDLEALFKAKDRRKASPAAPPQGLFLMKVNYNESSSKDVTCKRPSSTLSSNCG